MRGDLTATQIFLLYALPAVDFCIPKERREETRQRLERALQHPDEISIEEIAKTFPRGFKEFPELKQFTKPLVVQYWEVEHNKIVDNSNRPDYDKRLCKVYETVVSKVDLDQGFVNTSDNKLIILPKYHHDIRVGDKITTHKSQVARIK